jgi:hypothetical protein
VDHQSDREGEDVYELTLGNRVTLIALLEILEEKGVLKKDEVFARVLEGPDSDDSEKQNGSPGVLPFRRSA